MNRRILHIIVPLLLVFCFTVTGLFYYNSIVKSQENIKAAKAEVENTYQRRIDLIPNLVKTVTAYANHEKETLVAVTQARQKTEQVLKELSDTNKAFIDKNQIGKLTDAHNELNTSVNALFAIVEKYPDLKANTNFGMLQEQLEGSENRISIARQRYNETVRRYNTKTMTFPGNVIAKYFGFSREEAYFEATPQAKQAFKLDI